MRRCNFVVVVTTASYAPTEKGVRWSSAFPINSQRLPMASRALFHHFSVEIALSGKGSLLAHLCRWNPRTPSTPTVGRPASLPHQVIRRMSPSQPLSTCRPLEPRPSRDIYRYRDQEIFGLECLAVSFLDVALAADAINIPSPQANTGVTFLDARGSSAPRLVVGFSLLRPSFCLRFNLLRSMSSGLSARRHLSLLCTLMSSTLPSDQIRGYIQDSGDSGSAGANVNYRRLLVECQCAEALIFAQRSADGYLMAPLRQPPP
ncbi:hypothetical protein T02_14302 [Trichinella nativa]|uniref:Uncharacterized protein n=1 Tax=Trichinella nativa TaxID=6335 RepID=A0A0V1L7U1_9BILA|nr:hypothetical protein T02_14302 [Trichinella nativa]